MNSLPARFGGFFIACILAIPAQAITVTEVKKPVMCTWKDVQGAQISVQCAYLAHLWIKLKRGCPECEWKTKKL